MKNPWRHLSPQSPFVLREDRECIERFNDRLRSRKSPCWIHVKDVLPEPFAGAVKSAPVLLLLSNPGFKEANRKLHLQPEFQDVLWANLRHEDSDWPFYFFDPQFDSCKGEYPGVAMWKEQTRELAEEVGSIAIAENGYETDESVGRQVLAKKLAIVEWFPYRSPRFKQKRCCTVPSQAYGFQLVKDAMIGRAIIIIGRGHENWFESVPSLDEYNRVMRLSTKRRIWLTRNNLKWWSKSRADAWDTLLEALTSTASRQRN